MADGGAELRALAADLRAAGPKVKRQASQVVRKSGQALQNHARRNAPVDTGFLQSSIYMATDSTGLAAIISPTAHYAHFQEHGTIYQPAQPFMGPGADAIEPSFTAAMEQLGGDIL